MRHPIVGAVFGGLVLAATFLLAESLLSVPSERPGCFPDPCMIDGQEYAVDVFVRMLTAERAAVLAAILGVLSFVLVVVNSRYWPKLPAAFALVAVGIAAGLCSSFDIGGAAKYILGISQSTEDGVSLWRVLAVGVIPFSCAAIATVLRARAA